MIYFTADTHFGHNSIIEYDNRPVETSEEMDELLIDNWNSIVCKSDRVYHCGDFSWRGSEFTKNILQKLNGQVHLIKGNHDHINKEIAAMFVSVSQLKRIKIREQRIWLSHFPLKTWTGKGIGVWNLHGHSHGRLENPELHSLDIGVINWDWKPVSLENIKQKMEIKYPIELDVDALEYCDFDEDY